MVKSNYPGGTGGHMSAEVVGQSYERVQYPEPGKGNSLMLANIKIQDYSTPTMSEQQASASLVGEDAEKVYPDLDGVASEGDLDLMKVYKRGFKPVLTAEQEVEHAQRIEIGEFAKYLQDHPEEQGASKVDPDELEWLISDGEQAFNDFIAANLALVLHHAVKYQGRGVPILDIVEEGNIGLIRALQKFDYSKGFKFSTYAKWWIRKGLRQGMVENSRNIVLPREKYLAVTDLKIIRGKFFQENGREATTDELVAKTGLTSEVVKDLIAITPDTEGLDVPLDSSGEGARSFGDLIQDDQSELAIRSVEHTNLREAVNKLLDELTPLQSEVIRRFFGFTGKDLSGPEVGAVYEQTGQWALNKKTQTMARLRKLASPALKELL